MAQFSIDINDDMVETVFDSFARAFNYDITKIADETKQDFTRRQVIAWIKTVVVNAQSEKAITDARAAAEAATNANLVIQ